MRSPEPPGILLSDGARYFDEVIATKRVLERVERFRDEAVLHVLHELWRPLGSLTRYVVAGVVDRRPPAPWAEGVVRGALLEVAATATRAVEVAPPIGPEPHTLTADDLQQACRRTTTTIIRRARGAGRLPLVTAPADLLEQAARAARRAVIASTSRSREVEPEYEALLEELLTLSELPYWVLCDMARPAPD